MASTPAAIPQEYGGFRNPSDSYHNASKAYPQADYRDSYAASSPYQGKSGIRNLCEPSGGVIGKWQIKDGTSVHRVKTVKFRRNAFIVSESGPRRNYFLGPLFSCFDFECAGGRRSFSCCRVFFGAAEFRMFFAPP